MNNTEKKPEDEPQHEDIIDKYEKKANNQAPKIEDQKLDGLPQKPDLKLKKIEPAAIINIQDTKSNSKIKSDYLKDSTKAMSSRRSLPRMRPHPNYISGDSIPTEPSSSHIIDLLSPVSIHSASTLQHAPKQISFAKSPRFHEFKLSDWGISELQLPSSLKTGSTSFGYGKKVVMSELSNKDLVKYPSPNHYRLKSTIDNALKKKFTFGESRSAVAKACFPGQVVVLPEASKDLPGPGEYEINRDNFGSPTTTLKARGKMFNEHISDNAPPPNYYTYKTDFVVNQRFSKITFGFGKKYDFTKTTGRNPGPGTYKLPSIFDKYDKSRYQNNLRNKPPLTFEQA